MKRISGIINLKVDGEMYSAKGDFTYNLGLPKREPIIGSDGQVHGYKEVPQEAFIEGAITDNPDLDLEKFLSITEATASLDLANGKTIVIREAFNASEGKVGTSEGEIETKFVGAKGEEIH